MTTTVKMGMLSHPPTVKIEPAPAMGRQDICRLSKGGVGLELGVASGDLSERFLQTGKFRKLYSVDRWSDHGHPPQECVYVKERLAKYPESIVIRSPAEEFTDLVPDEYFDFIYIDCYAHTGQEDGKLLEMYWPKLKPGGLFSGDDYDEERWPATFAAVNRFAGSVGCAVKVFGDFEPEHPVWDQSPSWFFFKENPDG
jgi:hypothetical protein